MDMVAGRVWADERRPIRHVDWVLVLLTVVLTVVGLVLLHSISATTPGEAAFWLVRVMKQGATAGFGLLFVALIAAFDYRFFKVYAGSSTSPHSPRWCSSRSLGSAQPIRAAWHSAGSRSRDS